MNRDTGNVTEVVTKRSKEDETGHKITSYVIAGNPTEGLITLRHRDGTTEQMDAKDIMEVTSDETSASLREALADAVRQEAMNEYASAWTSAQLEQAQQGNMPTEQTQGEQTTQAESAPVEEATQATPSQEEQAQYSISADARYSQMDTQQAWEDILSKTEGDETMAQEVVAETIAEKKAELRALEEAPAPKGSNLEERIANKKQHKEQIAKAKAEIEHWEQIAGAKEHKTEIPVQQNTPSIKTTEQWQAEAKEHNTNLNAEEIATQTGVKASRIQKVIDWANKMGVKLNFEAYTTTGNAGTGQLTNAQVYADRREMTISKLMLSEGLDIAWVAGHELTHQVRENGTKQDWEAYKATIKTMLGEEAWNKGILQRAMLYRQAYKNMNDADFLDAMEEELCADVAGDIFTNTNNINKVLGIAQSWPQRLLNTIVDTLRNIFGNGAPRKYRDALSAWEKLAKEKAQAEGNGNITNAEPKHSIVGVKGEHAVSEDVAREEQVVRYSVSPLEMSEEERYQRGEKLRNAPAVDVQSNTIVATPELSARKVAEQWWEDNVPEPMLYETEVGEVEINKNSIESSLAHRYGQKKLDAITSLVEGFENAVYLGTLPDGNRQEGVYNHYFAYPINYDDKRNYVFCRAMQDANKNRLYVHEVFVEDKITKGNTLQTAAFQPHGGISLYRDILANVLSASKDTQSAPSEQENERENSANGAESNVEVTKEEGKFSIANRNQDIFVSNAKRAVEVIKQEKATPEQWLAMIQKQGGLKAGEDKWLGLSEWLKGMDKKSVTKQEILDFIEENMIQIEEVHYGENSSGGYEKLDEEILDLWREAEGNGYEKAEQVQNVLNERYDGFADAAEIWYDGSLRVKDEGALAEILGEDNPINSTRLNYSTEGLENKQEIALTVPTIEPWNTSDEIHFGDAGGGRAVAWIRFGETTDAEGKEVLVIDEIQSKRHQEGREKGYRDADTKELLDAAVNAYRSATHEHDTYRVQLKEKYDYNSFGGSLYDKNVQFINSLTQEERANLDELISKQRKAAEALDKARDAQKAIPDAPFDKNWQGLAMKRMLRYAAENGFDKVAWTTGEQQAERYDIGTVVKNIEVNAVADSETGEVLEDEFEVYTRSNTNGGGFIPEATGRMSTNQIKEVFGKDLGNKIIESGRSSDNTVIEGRGLRIGGEGMKGFYNKILPSFVNKYVKKWGAKVGEVNLPELEESAQHMWSVDVTPEMKESVMQGQVMFSISPDIMAANERFNEELDEYIQKGSKANFIFHVGQPLGVMKLFFPELPIVMRPRVINKASNTKHDVDVASLYNLPQYIAEPIFVFQREDGAIGILTEMTDNNGKNVCVAVELNKKIQDGGTYLDVNDIRSIHGRDVKNIVLPIIHNSTLKYADKEKALEWFSSASSIYQQEITSQELFDATKIIENFQNPPLPEDNSSQSPQNVTPTGQNKVNYSIYGGNKGYVGYSMSKRAANARAEGRFPKGDFKKEYNITDASLDMLTQAGVISNSEWHHTSMYGNKTYFYGWGEDGFAEHYAENKAEIDKQARQLSKSKPNIEEFEPTTEGMRLYDKANQEWKEQRDAVVNDWQDKFYEASEQWKQQEEEQKAKAHEEWLEQTEYNNYVRDLNVPAEFNASNGVRVVTNGSGLPAKWEYYWGENAAFKKYANAAREELEKHLKENKGEVPTFEEWKNQKGQTLFSISTPPRQANESIIDYAHRVAQDMEKKRKAQALGRGIADLEDDIELTTEHLRIIGDNEPHTIDEAAATALAGTKLLWEDYTDGKKEISA